MKPHRVVNRATAFAHISEHYAKCKGIYALNPVEMEQSEKCSLHQIGKSKWQSLSGTAHGYTAEYKLLTDWRQYYRISTVTKVVSVMPDVSKKLVVLLQPVGTDVAG